MKIYKLNEIIEDLKKIPDELNDPTVVYQAIEFICYEDDIKNIVK